MSPGGGEGHAAPDKQFYDKGIPMRTLLNDKKSTGMSDTILDFIKFKLWSSDHIEFEVQIDKFSRHPVLHMISLPDNKIVVGGSFEKHLDFILDMSFYEFDSLGMHPITKKLLKNQFVRNKGDAF